MDSCLQLLIPTPEEFAIPEAEKDTFTNYTAESSSAVEKYRKRDESNSSDEDAKQRETGIIDPVSHTVNVTLKPSNYLLVVVKYYLRVFNLFVYCTIIDFRKRVKKTEDNSAIIESANEQVKLISDKYLPKIKKWLQDIAKISSNYDILILSIFYL